ncbi:MAG: hypothetical protein J6Y20_07155 [Lachnospiraceae bacterium]|nr:hypothetical protein [Lachnospiraceae bacterium]
MTVKELIQELEKYPQDYTVKVTRDGIDGDIYLEDIHYGLDEKEKELVL